ncbi:hypothetical protein AB0N65_03605 [Paenarthrobacter sp. NPDC089322]|uniref:hypothetical protein n=1 Tax=Paenarthrobacter sp. NPDC089322 TaxID=3155065 RepID=UPI0034442AEB
MDDEASFYAPLVYQQHWLWLGLALLLIVTGWYAWLLLPRAIKRSAILSETTHDLESVRAACLRAIGAIELDVDGGRMLERDAHQRLSLLVREFAAAATGLPAASMTLEELRRHGLDHFAVRIARIYPNEFAPVAVQSVRDSANAAREAVEAWN